MLPKSIDLTDLLATDCSKIRLMWEQCYVFRAKCEEPTHLPNRKKAQMQRLFFKELTNASSFNQRIHNNNFLFMTIYIFI